MKRRNKKISILQKQITEYQQYDKKEENSAIRLLSKYFSGSALTFLVSQIRCTQYKKKGMRWNEKEREIFLYLYYMGPRVYRHLCNLFCLPHISTIKRWLNCLQVYPGFDNSLFAILKEACQHLSPENRICAICLDEMSIKSHLNYNFGQDKIEGNENYGLLGSTKLIANYALVFGQLCIPSEYIFFIKKM